MASDWPTFSPNRPGTDKSVLALDTIGDQQPTALGHIPGTAKGAVPEQFTTSARLVYPVFDGVNLSLGTVADYPSDFASPTNFANWHSAFQAEYIASQPGAEFQINDPNPPNGILAFFMLDDAGRPINLYSLTLSDYARLSEAEKSRFDSNLDTLGVLGRLRLTTDADTKTDWLNGSNVSGTNTNPEINIRGTGGLIAAVNGSNLTTADKKVFADQYELVAQKIEGNFGVSKDKIAAELAAITERFIRVEKFVDAPMPRDVSMSSFAERDGVAMIEPMNRLPSSGTADGTFIQSRVNSLDEGETIRDGVQKFMVAERAILAAKDRRAAIAGNSSFRDPNLDVPNLIFKLQLLYEGESEGVADSGTEEIKQLHKLLQDYSVMQRLINETIKAFDPGESSEQRRFMNIGAKSDGSVEEQQTVDLTGHIDAVCKFEDVYTESGAGSPFVTEKEGDRVPLFHWSLLAEKSNDVTDLYEDVHLHHTQNGLFPSISPGSDISPKLNETEMRAFSMFAQADWASKRDRWHPIEDLFGVDERPTFDFITNEDNTGNGGNLKLQRKTAFDSFQTTLADTITILNQQNQIKQNDIENATKQQNRHFELGNNALRKMNDLLLTIGRM